MVQGRELRRAHLRLVAPLQEQVALQQVQESPLQALEALLQELEHRVVYHLREMELALVLVQLEAEVLESGVKQALERVQAQVQVARQEAVVEAQAEEQE